MFNVIFSKNAVLYFTVLLPMTLLDRLIGSCAANLFILKFLLCRSGIYRIFFEPTSYLRMLPIAPSATNNYLLSLFTTRGR